MKQLKNDFSRGRKIFVLSKERIQTLKSCLIYKIYMYVLEGKYATVYPPKNITKKKFKTQFEQLARNLFIKKLIIITLLLIL